MTDDIEALDMGMTIALLLTIESSKSYFALLM